MTAYDTPTLLALPAAPATPGYTWRPPQRADGPAMHALLLRIDQAEGRDASESLEDFMRNFEDPWLNTATDSLIALAPDGEIAAMGLTHANPDPGDKARCFLWGEVHPDHRGRGLGEALFSWMEARASQRLLDAPAGMARALRIFCRDDAHDRISLFERHDFQIIRYFYRMRRDLAQPIPEASLPAGLTLRTYGADVDQALLEAFNEAFSDHWDFIPATREEWDMFILGRAGFRPDLSFIVMDGPQVAGFSMNRINPDENARSGKLEGWIGQLGVRRPWRKRGLASALLCRSMRAFQAEDLAFAKLGVDAANPTGALQLYERLGFQTFTRFLAFARDME